MDDVLQELLDARQKHVELLDRSIEAGESLCSLLSCKGPDVIRQQTDALQQECDELFKKVTSSLQQLEAILVKWTSYTDSIGDVEAWLAEMRTLVSDELPLVGTLDEKKTQLQTFKVI